MLPVILLGGLYSGVTTPTEAAAVAAAYALLISTVLYRSLGWADVYASLVSSARLSISIGMLIAGALVFNYVITIENIPKTLSTLLKAYELSPLGFLLLFMMTKIANVPLKDLVREVMPFLAVMIGALAMITLWPDFVLFLPRLAGYKG